MAGATGSRLVNIDNLKAEIAQELTITDVAERLCGVDLQRSGGQWQGLCPLHDENTPSFYTNDSKALYHCFGCKAGGDSIDLVRRVRNLEFVEALYLLAAEADVEIEKYERPLTDEEKYRERLRGDCEKWLADLPTDQIDRVSPEVAAEFGIGRGAGFGQSGLTLESYLSRGIIFPYRLPNGKLVGWKARAADKKMFATPHTFPLHQDTLFGIQVARDHLDDGTIILVEGEYDCLTAHDAELRNVAALGGSSLTTAQMEILEHHHIRQVTLVFDGDDAGRMAARSMADRYWAADVAVRVVVCQEGEDPDSLIRQYGIFPFELMARGARHALEYLLWIEWQARARDTLSDKLEFVSWIRETYGAKLRATDESLILQEVAKWLEIPEIEVRDFARQSDTSLQATDSERILLGHAIRDIQFYIDLRRRFTPEDFYLVKHQRLWDVLARVLVEGLDFDVLTVGRHAENEGVPMSYVRELATLTSGNVSYHEDLVLDMALRRTTRDETLAFKSRITDINVPSDVLVGELTSKITDRVLRKSGSQIKQIREQVDHAMDTLHERMRRPDEVHGLDLGDQFPETSRRLQGLQSRRLILLAASSGMGKSTLALQWATSLSIRHSVPTDFISLEMDETEIVNKVASHMTGIDSMKISGGRLEKPDVKRVEAAMQRIRSSPLHIWAPDGLSSIEFLLYARESVMQRRTEAFFVDYIQLTDPDPGMERDSGYTQYGHFGRMAKMKVARAMGVAVLCVAQLKREAASKETPEPEDMGDSYALVRHADVIMIIAGKPENTLKTLRLSKNRQGVGGGDVVRPLTYDKPINTFYESSHKEPSYLVRA